MNTLHTKTTALFAAILLGLTGSVMAAAMPAPMQLSGKNEVPPVMTKATGSSMIMIAADGAVTGHITTSGITGTAAHIHMAAMGSNGPPIITLTKGSKGQWMVPPGSKLTAEQLTAYKAGGLYVNVHNKAHMEGAIRMQLSM